MSRNLIVCIDGTWNISATSATNVWRVSQRLLNDDNTQRVLYFPGVGTLGLLDRVFGGVWGRGITQQIETGYLFLCEAYKPGDYISFFGFSRGAFAVRAILGLLTNFGVLRRCPNQIQLVREAISLYRNRDIPYREKISFGKENCYERKPEILFVGVWDTVIRYGPLLAPVQIFFQEYFGLHDHQIPETVKRFCHALALDERRAAFWPWRAEPLPQSPPEQVEEIWFAGVHSDVGGGYEDSRLAELPLRWICERAAATGLIFNSIPTVSADSYLAGPHQSRRRFWRMLPSRKRIVRDSDHLHDSAILKMRTTGYRPAAKLPEKYRA